MSRRDTMPEAVLSIDEGQGHGIAGPAYIVQPNGSALGDWFIEFVDSPTWEDLRQVATRQIAHTRDPDHRFLELVGKVNRNVLPILAEATLREMPEATDIYQFFMGS